MRNTNTAYCQSSNLMQWSSNVCETLQEEKGRKKKKALAIYGGIFKLNERSKTKAQES